MARPHCNYIALYEADRVGPGKAKGSGVHFILCCIVTRAAALKPGLTINSVNRETRPLNQVYFIYVAKYHKFATQHRQGRDA